MNKRKIFGIGAVVIIILFTIIPATYGMPLEVRTISKYSKNLSTSEEIDWDKIHTVLELHKDDGEEINANRKYENEKEEYETSPEYKGWEENSNFSMTLFVEVSHYFSNVLEKYSNIVEHTEKHEFTTTQGSSIGDEDPPVPWNWSKPYEKNRKENLLNYDKYYNQKDIKDQVLYHIRRRYKLQVLKRLCFLYL